MIQKKGKPGTVSRTLVAGISTVVRYLTIQKGSGAAKSRRKSVPVPDSTRGDSGRN